jgi:NADH-quinone oxidoreductase subunit M
VQRVVLGVPSRAVQGAADLSLREVAVLLPLVALTLTVGVYWDSLLRFVDPAVTSLLALVGAS